MPAVSRWFIRSSLLCLASGMVIGALLMINKALLWAGWIWMLLPIHIELLIFGWIIQFTMGTAYWILPRFLEGPKRGNASLAKFMVVLYNLGLSINISNVAIPGDLPLVAVGRVLELAAVALFALLHWQRAVSYNN